MEEALRLTPFPAAKSEPAAQGAPESVIQLIYAIASMELTATRWTVSINSTGDSPWCIRSHGDRPRDLHRELRGDCLRALPDLRSRKSMGCPLLWLLSRVAGALPPLLRLRAVQSAGPDLL
jgi:hypothetical protein